ncbi:hypothetical protein L484_026765 [Morus notabilis]|uniref:Uncharacterized protein n=1 Tax=Morus notabilis TaxID=981085 RepID=W9SCZ2_9ROSA|nr:hypothetical protein L484_026765 [Morus notabilis]
MRNPHSAKPEMQNPHLAVAFPAAPLELLIPFNPQNANDIFMEIEVTVVGEGENARGEVIVTIEGVDGRDVVEDEARKDARD